jgi:hypothetical protein
MIILWKCQVGIYFFLLSSQIFFFKIQNQNIWRKDFLVGLSYDHSFISFFLLVYGRTILVLQFFFINLPLKLFNFNFIWFFFLSVYLILIRLAKCWNNCFSSKLCIWLYCENGKYMIILWKCQVEIYFFLLSSQIFFFKIQNQNNFLGKKTI